MDGSRTDRSFKLTGARVEVLGKINQMVGSKLIEIRMKRLDDIVKLDGPNFDNEIDPGDILGPRNID